MLVPSNFRENFVDNFFDDFFRFPFDSGRSSNARAINTDVKELDGKYIMDLELPGYDKEDIKAELDNGYLTITANRLENKEEKDENGKFIRRERYSGSCKRSFYVGDNITEEDINAKFKNGILSIELLKKEAKTEVEEKRYLEIEG